MPKKENKLLIYPLELESITDIARLAYNFDYTSDPVFLDKKSKILFIFGEKILNSNIIYFIKLNNYNEEEFIKYILSTIGNDEKAELTSKKSDDINTSFYINIIKIENYTFKFSKTPKDKSLSITLSSLSDLVKLSLLKNPDDNKINKLYSFKEGSNSFLFGIDLIDALHDDKKIFYISEYKSTVNPSFIAYDYKNNKMEFQNKIGDHQFLYVKIINLKNKPIFI
ncbi:MAG: hypothetical protein ACP5M9_00805 [Candidatus Micrarchaeia archaeon]